MNTESTIDAKRLAEITGYTRQADIEKWCYANGVPFFRGKAGVWTTLTALDTALGVKPGQPSAAKMMPTEVNDDDH